ncbi:TPA: polysaccharide deacetylase family protein [Streptococcus suis]
MKKLLLILTNLLLVGMICFLSLVIYHRIQESQVTQFIESQERVFLKSGQANLRTGNVGSTHVVASIPTDNSGKKIGLVENKMVEYVQQSLGETKPTGNINRIFLVSSHLGKTNFRKVRSVVIKGEKYHLSKMDIKKDGEETAGELLLTEDQQLFTLSRIFSDPIVAKKIIVAKLIEKLDQENLSDSDKNALVSQLETTDLDAFVFSYENSQLTLVLPTNTVLPTFDIPVADLFPVIIGEYLTDADQASLEQYKQELQRIENNKSSHQISLTFDDGPNPSTTPLVLDLLKKHNAKATFFVLGQNIEGNEWILQRMKAEGHEIANHSWSHPNLTNLSPDAIHQEIEKTQVAIEKAVGQRPVLVRPPYGAVNRKVASAMNLPSIYWNVDTQDWSSHNPQAILNQVKTNACPGCFILMHDIHKETVKSLDSVLQFLTSQGYSMVTVSESLGNNLNPQFVYYNQHSAAPPAQ